MNRGSKVVGLWSTRKRHAQNPRHVRLASLRRPRFLPEVLKALSKPPLCLQLARAENKILKIVTLNDTSNELCFSDKNCGNDEGAKCRWSRLNPSTLHMWLLRKTLFEHCPCLGCNDFRRGGLKFRHLQRESARRIRRYCTQNPIFQINVSMYVSLAPCDHVAY